jgi:biotin carboxylase
MRNLIYPLDWDAVFDYVGFPAFLKPYSGGGWKSVYRVENRDEFFRAYDDTGDLCMTLQQGIEFTEYFRCYVVGQKRVHIMQYDPRLPHAHRYVLNPKPVDPELLERVERDAIKLCVALGYDLNTVEFAVQDGVPYAIDFLNPAPDADYHSVGAENFSWIVNAVADLAIEKAQSGEKPGAEMRWNSFL